MKQTAVEFLEKELERLGVHLYDEVQDAIDKAKAMEKEHISNSMLHGWREALDPKVGSIDPNDFYNKTFKSE